MALAWVRRALGCGSESVTAVVVTVKVGQRSRFRSGTHGDVDRLPADGDGGESSQGPGWLGGPLKTGDVAHASAI